MVCMKQKILFIIAGVVIVVIIALLLWRPDPFCKMEYASIDREVKAANYCSVDADCAALSLGGELIEFGCYHYVNKEIDQERLMERMVDHVEKCSEMINDCDYAPGAKCVDGKCVEA